MLIAIYDYLGYYNVCHLGDEVREPGKTIPRAVHPLGGHRGGDLPDDEHLHHRRRAVAGGDGVEEHRGAVHGTALSAGRWRSALRG